MFETIPAFEKLTRLRKADLSEPLDLYLQIADALQKLPGHALKGRGSFIRDQCSGFDGKTIFRKYRESWGIPVFEKDLVNLSDFKRGFLYRFRDQGSGAKDGQKAKAWLLQSEESLMVRRYEKWSNGSCLYVLEGTFQEILQQLSLP